MPYITLFPIGELLNHDNVETYYIYQYPHEKPDASSRYSGIIDNIDHDDNLLIKDTLLNLNHQKTFELNQYIKKLDQNEHDIIQIKKYCEKIDAQEEVIEQTHKKYRPPDIDLSERDEKEASICAGPNEHYLPGSEVYMSYGRYSNRQLLSTYGFALRENHFNYASVRTTLSDFIINEEQAAAFHSYTGVCIFKIKKNALCIHLLRTIRGLYWNQEFSVDAFFNPLSVELEIRVFTQAIKIISNTLSKFPTTLELDLNILTQDIPLRRYFAILYRSQVKEILKIQEKLLIMGRRILEKMLQGNSFEESNKIIESEENEESNY